MTTGTAPHVLWSRPPEHRVGGTLLVALHGRGATERDFGGLATHLPGGITVASVRGPLPEGGGFAWFANRGIGRPLPESLAKHTDDLMGWLDTAAVGFERVVLLGFSGGAAMAGSLLLTDPARFAGAVLLSGTLPWDAGLDLGAGVLDGKPVFYGRSDDDPVIPHDLIHRTLTWLRTVSGAALVEPDYDGFGHAISAGELADIVAFIAEVLADRLSSGRPG